MPKSSPERTGARREEIIDACERLYRTMSFQEVTLSRIGECISFTRTSIYNYFQNKEEIFVALLTREYRRWVASLQELMEQHGTLTVEEFASALAHSLEERPQLLKLVSMNHYDMEAACRLETYIDYKRAYGASIQMMKSCLDKFFPALSAERKRGFIFSFFPFMFGIYPYTEVTEKQKAAMQAAGILDQFIFMSVNELISNCVRNLLNA